MSCDTLVMITKKVSDENGVTPVISSYYVPHDKKKETATILKSQSHFLNGTFNKRLSKKLFSENGTFNANYIQKLLKKSKTDILNEIISMGDPLNIDGIPLSSHIVQTGLHMFTFEDVEKLGNPTDKYDSTLAHHMARRHFPFTVEQIEKLGNPVDRYKYTLAHICIGCQGAKFYSFEDILRLKNPPNLRGVTLAHEIIRAAPFQNLFTVEQLVELNNPADDSGETLAHDMINHGNRVFNEQEIDLLGDPKNAKGISISTLIEWRTTGHRKE